MSMSSNEKINAMRRLMEDNDVIIIDPENEFKELAEMLGCEPVGEGKSFKVKKQSIE